MSHTALIGALYEKMAPRLDQMGVRTLYEQAELPLCRVLAEMEKQPLDPMELVYPGEVPLFEKYDEFLPAELVKKGFAYGILGIDEMKMRIRSWNKV